MEREYKLLIVDDESEILNTYKEYFAKRDFQVEVASNGIEGLEKLIHGEFDVAIVDIQMPKMNGIEMIRLARKEGVDTDMVILTGHGDRDDAVAAINLGVSAWFEKPSIEMSKLKDKVVDIAQVISLTEVERILSAIPNGEQRDRL
ncbi:MAG: response regulator [Anaerolineae bacterium]